MLDCILKNPDCVDRKGGKLKESPLYYAAKNGRAEVVKLLLRYGAEDEDDGRILREADPSVRKVLIDFGFGRVGGIE